MAVQWIDAATARSMISALPEHKSERLAAVAICKRAHYGILPSRAKLFVAGKHRTTGAEVPDYFWWAKGEVALKQNWGSGDFSTYINKTIPCETFGATFILDGLLDMLPPNQRNAPACSLSAARSSEWVRASEAAQLAVGLSGVRNGRTFLIEEARLGLVHGRAVMVQACERENPGIFSREERK